MSALLPYINFILFLGMLYFLLRKPAAAFAQGESEQYKLAAQSGAKALQEATKDLEQTKKQLAHLHDEIEERRRRAMEIAKDEVERLGRETRLACEQLQNELTRSSSEELARVKQELTAELVTLARDLLVKRLNEDLKDIKKRESFMEQSVASVQSAISGRVQ